MCTSVVLTRAHGYARFSVTLWLISGHNLAAARNEQEMIRAFHEIGALSVGFLEPLQVIAKLIVDCQRRRVPSRIRREAAMKQVEAAQLIDVD